METKQCTKCKRTLPMDTNHFKKSCKTKDGFYRQCKECTGSHFKPYVKEGYKICSQCKRELPLNEYHFMKKSDRKSGFSSQCKECQGYKFTNPKPIVGEGYKICTKCGRELKATTDYFFKQSNSELLMGYCKECGGYKFTKHLEVKEGYKICSKCGKELPSTTQYFFKHNGGLYPSCKKCNGSPYSDNEGYKTCSKCGNIYPATKEYFYPNKECKHGVSSICKTCHSQYYKKWSKTDKAKQGAVRVRQIRRSRKKHLVTNFTTAQWEQCLKFFNYKDAYTGLEMDIKTQDHIIPVCNGGNYIAENIIPCDAKINASKGNRNMEDWFKSQEFYSEERLNKIYEWINLNKKTKHSE